MGRKNPGPHSHCILWLDHRQLLCVIQVLQADRDGRDRVGGGGDDAGQHGDTLENLFIFLLLFLLLVVLLFVFLVV
ncbi:hypothetical protein EYF80_029020 [Liparis tanakae]|uniref:Uncharacterized protein n=1 Tax=Liparis tanakae TaxID=230148 RepID=A0A4Z2H4Z2_9TELE|nr:hypothetical protein EYF80_029020 [Liparis tanakae]